MSDHEPYTEIGRLLVEHGARRKEYAHVVQRLKGIAQAFAQNQALVSTLNADSYAPPLDALKTMLARNGGESIAPIVKLIDIYTELRLHLDRDLQTLKQYGVK
ncbi:MAG: hypothetical protein WA324_13085 [Bryobacteraceae bacterium]